MRAALLLLLAGTLAWPQGADSEFDRYLQRAQTLKKHFDTGGLDEKGMLEVLRAQGVLEPLAPGEAGKFRSFAGGFRPFDVRVYRGLWRWPLRAGIVSSEYGRRWGRRHHGIDIAADEGVPVSASAAGTVIYAGSTLKGYGNVVIVRHDQQTTTLYAHNKDILVKAGQRVAAGQNLANLGSTGRSTGPHVHFEFRRLGQSVDPRGVLIKSRF